MKISICFCSSLLALFSFSVSNAQLERYTPEVVLDYVNGHAKNGASDTYLTTIASVNGTIPTPLAPIATNFSFADGKNLAWLYLYYSPSQTRFFLYAVTRLSVLGNVTNTAFEIEPSAVSLDTASASKKEIPNNFLSSALILPRLQTDAVFNKFRIDYPDTLPDYVSVLKLEDDDADEFPELNGNDPYWIVSYQDLNNFDASMFCFVNSENQDVLCIRLSDLTSVADQTSNTSKILVSPNPVQGSMAAVQLPKLFPNGTLYLYNSIGELVGDLSRYLRTSQLSIPISTSGLQSGMYYLRLQDGITTFTTPIVIQ